MLIISVHKTITSLNVPDELGLIVQNKPCFHLQTQLKAHIQLKVYSPEWHENVGSGVFSNTLKF